MNSSDVLTRRSSLITGSGVLAAALAACGPNAPAAPDGAVVDAAVQPIYDLDGGIVTLANGVNMPINGLGTYALSVEEAAESVYWAIEAGA